MKNTSLAAVVNQQLQAARQASSGRSACTIHGGSSNHLRQTVLALSAGRRLGEHDSPGEATLQVLTGRIELSAGNAHWQGQTGDFVEIPRTRHDVTAHEDSAFLLTVVTRPLD